MAIHISSINASDIVSLNPISLAIETSGRTGSIALGAGESIIAQMALSGFQKHSSELLPAIQTLLKQHNLPAQDINHIYLTTGPGSFTGIRISVGFAKMAAFASGCKIVSINTLDALAENATSSIHSYLSHELLATILDAKKGLFYIALFQKQKNQFKRISIDFLTTASDFIAKYCSQGPIDLLGEGLLYHQKQFQHPNITILDESLWPAKAISVWKLAKKLVTENQFTDPLTLVPNYVRRPEAEENWEKKLNLDKK